MKESIKKYIELEVQAIQNIPIDGVIENVLESLEKDGLIATRTDKNGEKDIIPISDIIAKAVKDANTK